MLPQGARFDRGSFSNTAGSRDYRVYVPNLEGKAPSGLVMMLHGCTQSPEDFAAGTDMNRIAETHGLIVVYPAQSRGANMQSCWNWFAPADQERGAGEPAILAGLALDIARQHEVPDGRIFVAGLSAGAAMAVILGRTHGDIFAAVGVHSGLPYKSAHDVPSAFAAMGGGTGASVRAAAQPVPTIIFHGTADSTVNVGNARMIFDQAGADGVELIDDGTGNGRAFSRTTTLSEGGTANREIWLVEGLGHAWSGGNAAGSYTDPKGPQASAEMVRFFLDTPQKGA